MAGRNQRTVGPKKGGKWEITGGEKPQPVATQKEGVAKATRQLKQTGGGELKIKGRDGKIRGQNTIGRKDPEKSQG